ncbi:MAG: PBP1A family penicillin-binding protein [Candidatus Melainabacteria bacterium]|nr:PBP1A family penicillin-binding protein [Candidatus Melainabacteria bacterium]
MNKYVVLLSVFLGILIGAYISLPSVNRMLGLPEIGDLTEYQPISSIELYDYRDSFVGFLQGEEDRQVVSLSEISPNLIRAVLAIEDKDFYDHFGIDPIGIVRAFFVNLKAGKIVEGGSTITQQLVKNLLIPEKERRRTFSRKFKEVFLALELERKVNKDKILELYLNQVYWGHRAYGIQRAAQRYFNKTVTELDLAESAYLGGLLQAPSRLSADFKAARTRQILVLNKMLEFGFITKEQLKEAKKKKLKFSSSPGHLELYPYYFSYVLEELKERFDMRELKEKGYKVYTGLDPSAQRITEEVLNAEIKNAPYGVTQLALAAIDVKTGQVRALVGGVGGFWEHQWNRATNPHTIGSAFKPFTYLTAFEKGIATPDTIIKDSRVKIPDGVDMVWEPKNFDKKFWGKMTVRKALTYSRNLPAVKVAKKVGIEEVIKTAKACGIETELEPHLSLALGSAALSPLEVASAYSTFARQGVYIKPILIRKIEDPKGRIIEKNDPIPQRAASSIAASYLVSILQDVVQKGTGTLARLEDRAVAGKTGTSDESRDVWFIGFTPDLSCAIWGGNDHNQSIYGQHVTGGAIVARIWKIVAEEYYADKDIPPAEFSGAPGMKELLVDPLTGLLATEYTPNPIKKRFVPGSEPTEYAPVPPGAKKINPIKKLFYGPFFSKLGGGDTFEIKEETDEDKVAHEDEFEEDEETSSTFLRSKIKIFKENLTKQKIDSRDDNNEETEDENAVNLDRSETNDEVVIEEIQDNQEETILRE